VRAGRVLADYFQRQRLARGMPKAEAVKRILPGRAAELSDVYLAWLAAQQVLSVAGDQVNLPGREAELTGRESELSRSLLAAVEQGGLTPPAPAELAVRLGAKPQIVDGLVRYLVERGELLRLPDGLVVSAAAAGGLRAELAASGWERFTVADFKDRFGLSRKWAIPWLEHLDSSGATRRLGDQRQVVR
jgi:selenocysteine-specific elongation factor